MSIRKQIVDTLITKFATIPNIATVDKWAVGSLDITDLPAIVVRDENSTTEAGGEKGVEINNIIHRLEIAVDVITEGNTAVDDIDTIVTNVLSTIKTDETLGGLCDWCELTGIAKNIEQQENKIMVANVSLIFVYRTERLTI